MKISQAVEEYIAEQQEQAPRRGQNSRRHGGHSYLARTKEGEKITHDLRLVESIVVQEAEVKAWDRYYKIRQAESRQQD